MKFHPQKTKPIHKMKCNKSMKIKQMKIVILNYKTKKSCKNNKSNYRKNQPSYKEFFCFTNFLESIFPMTQTYQDLLGLQFII